MICSDCNGSLWTCPLVLSEFSDTGDACAGLDSVVSLTLAPVIPTPAGILQAFVARLAE